MQALTVPYRVLRRVVELFCSIWVWASGLRTPAELLLGEPSGLSEHGLTTLLRRPAGGAKAPSDPRAQDALPSDWAG